MSLLSDLQTIAEHCGVPVETGVFSGKAPDTYLVITPLSDSFELHADNAPGCETQEVRLSLFTKGSYTKLKNALVRALLLISASEDGGDPVAVGFRAKKSNGKYKYYWLYRVKFGIPATNLATKGDSITFSTPTIEGTILRRNKADAGGKHPWKAEALEGDVPAATITGWYKEVYEPTYTASSEKNT